MGLKVPASESYITSDQGVCRLVLLLFLKKEGLVSYNLKKFKNYFAFFKTSTASIGKKEA